MTRTIRQARAELQAARQTYFHALDTWKDNPTTGNAAKVQKAVTTWEAAYDTYRRTRRKADWTRARRLIKLAEQGRAPLREHQLFVANGYSVLRKEG